MNKINTTNLSVVIVNYNGQKYMAKLLSSLTNQTYKHCEIIIVDNASSDGSVEFIKNNYPQCKVIQLKENVGFAKGNNIGIDEAGGKFILLMNNDTWVEEDFLQKMINFYEKNNFDVVAPYEATYEGVKKDPYITTIDMLGHPIYIKHNNKRSGFYLSGVCLMFSKELYNITGGLDSNFFMYFEEIDWFWRLNLLGKSFSYVPDVFIYHKGAGSTGGGINYHHFLWRNQNTLQMLLKNYSWVNLVWVLPIYILQNIIEIIFFLIILKPKISYSYIGGWTFNIKNLRITLRKRRWVQENRVKSDKYIISKMYLGPAKLKHLLSFISIKRGHY